MLRLLVGIRVFWSCLNEIPGRSRGMGRSKMMRVMVRWTFEGCHAGDSCGVGRICEMASLGTTRVLNAKFVSLNSGERILKLFFKIKESDLIS